MEEQTETPRQREDRAHREWNAVNQIFELYAVGAGPLPTQADHAQWWRLHREWHLAWHAAFLERVGSE